MTPNLRECTPLGGGRKAGARDSGRAWKGGPLARTLPAADRTERQNVRVVVRGLVSEVYVRPV